MKCRDMNPGNASQVALSTNSSSLNEVPGYESRQSCRDKRFTAAMDPLNEVPGYESRQSVVVKPHDNRPSPSMKCRDMNPGNGRRPCLPPSLATLNEVPGYESRQSRKIRECRRPFRVPSMKCRDMNPGNVFDRKPPKKGVSPSMKCRDMNPGNMAKISPSLPSSAPQ